MAHTEVHKAGLMFKLDPENLRAVVDCRPAAQGELDVLRDLMQLTLFGFANRMDVEIPAR